MGADGKTTIVGCTGCGRVRGVNRGRLEWFDPSLTMIFMLKNQNSFTLVEGLCGACKAQRIQNHQQVQMAL